MRFRELNPGGLNAPRSSVGAEFKPRPDVEVQAFRKSLPRKTSLEALLINRNTDTLVVALHGALGRGKYKLPRFEWLRTVGGMPTSSMYFSDPALRLHPRLELAWFTGWSGCDVPAIIVDWVRRAAEVVGASRVIFQGSSGGGFASLQLSSLMPNSMALAFNGQTDISAYRVSGVRYSAQRQYLRVVWPEVFRQLPDGNADTISPAWKKYVDDRVSAVDRYRSPQGNYLFMVQNRDEFHYEQHFEPLTASLVEAGVGFRLHTKLYRNGPGHFGPPPSVHCEALNEALEMCQGLPGIFDSVPDPRVSRTG